MLIRQKLSSSTILACLKMYSHSEYRANASAATVSLMVSRAPEDVREGVCPPEVKEELNTVRCAKARFVAVRA